MLTISQGIICNGLLRSDCFLLEIHSRTLFDDYFIGRIKNNHLSHHTKLRRIRQKHDAMTAV